MTSDWVEAAARVLVAFWRQPDTLNLGARQLCERLVPLLGEGAALAVIARSPSPSGPAVVAAAVRSAAERDHQAAGLARRLAEGGSPRGGRGSVTQNATVTGNGGVAFNVGRDFNLGGRLAIGPAGGETEADTKPVAAPDVILMAAADPVDLSRLRLGLEAREIREALRGSPGRDRWTVDLRSSVRLRDLSQALLEVQPRVVHFSGHGSVGGGLVLEDDVGSARLTPPEALNELFVAVEREVECVVLNACYSEPQGRAISARVPFVIGTTAAISDDAAIAFSVGFYQALGAGRSVRQAYSVGLASARAPGEEPPLVLLER